MKAQTPEPFSQELERWLRGKQPKTLASLERVFDERSFAIIFLLLMILPATPLPTGGLTHVFEIIVALLCLELVAGFRAPWLPKKWKHMKLSKTFTGKVIPTIMKWVRWFERRSSPRGGWVFRLPLFRRLTGLIILVLTVAAFLSPPFSFLDTLPSLGVVIISLSIILEDIWFWVTGTIIGTLGIGLTLALGTAILETYQHIF
jgi:hypothetical protein